MKITIGSICMIPLFFLSCTSSADKKTTVEEGSVIETTSASTVPDYKIMNTTKSNDFVDKISFDVEIPRKLTEEELEMIATQIKNQTSSKYQSIFISYYLPGMTIGAGSWALSTRGLAGNSSTINVKEQIKQTEVIPEKKKVQNDRDVIGRWRDSFGSVYMLYKKRGSYFLDNIYADGSSKTDKISVRRRNGVSAYNVTGDNSEYFVIQGNGDLYYYDNNGDLGMIWNAY